MQPTSRRSSTRGGVALPNSESVSGTVRAGLVFLHIPKCGGTSLATAIRHAQRPRSLLPWRRRTPTFHVAAAPSTRAARVFDPAIDLHSSAGDRTVLELRQAVVAYAMASDRFAFIHGHVPFHPDTQEAFPMYAWITLLRDPVDRWLSQFFYNRYKQSDHAKTECALDDHLDSETGIAQGHEVVKFLGGVRGDGKYGSRGAVDEAIENLDRFALVGLLEDLETFQDRFKARFGRRLQIPHSRKSPAVAEVRQAVTDEQRARIRQICAPDLAVYAAAQKMLHGGAA